MNMAPFSNCIMLICIYVTFTHENVLKSLSNLIFCKYFFALHTVHFKQEAFLMDICSHCWKCLCIAQRRRTMMKKICCVKFSVLFLMPSTICDVHCFSLNINIMHLDAMMR